MGRQANTVVVPANLTDVAGMIATAMKVFNTPPPAAPSVPRPGASSPAPGAAAGLNSALGLARVIPEY